MNDILAANTIKNLTQPIIEKGFLFEYFYQKGGDSSCVYICRYKKGRDFWDWREVSGSNEINIVTCINGEFGFPSLKLLHPQEYRRFQWKHFLKKATLDENRTFVATLLLKELEKKPNEFLGIKL